MMKTLWKHENFAFFGGKPCTNYLRIELWGEKLFYLLFGWVSQEYLYILFRQQVFQFLEQGKSFPLQSERKYEISEESYENCMRKHKVEKSFAIDLKRVYFKNLIIEAVTGNKCFWSVFFDL